MYQDGRITVRLGGDNTLERGIYLDNISSAISARLTYTAEQLEYGFDFITPTGMLQRADLVAFSESLRKDVATSCIAVAWQLSKTSRSPSPSTSGELSRTYRGDRA